MSSLKLSQVPASYALCCMFVLPCLGMLREIERVLAFVISFSFDPGSSRDIVNQNRKNVSFMYGAIIPRQGIPSPVLNGDVSIKVAAPTSPYKHLLEQQ